MSNYEKLELEGLLAKWPQIYINHNDGQRLYMIKESEPLAITQRPIKSFKIEVYVNESDLDEESLDGEFEIYVEYLDSECKIS